jgi:hypothetical protein
MKPILILSLAALAFAARAEPVAIERDGFITLEAESFTKQTHDDVRQWHVISDANQPEIGTDIQLRLADASEGSYIQVLPDTRRSHADKLIKGENFTEDAGTMAVLHYPIRISQPGRYHVWVRFYSTGSEDNGLHFGLNDDWPESGRRWQTVKKNAWHWDCAQRTTEVHNGVPMQLWLDIDQPGDHTLMLSMREDGAAVDQIILAASPDFRPPGFTETIASSAAKPVTPPLPTAPLVLPRQPDGGGSIAITGELKQWHKVTLALDGPFAHEQDTDPNPFTDLAFEVTFTHESGTPSYKVPGHFAADGQASETSAESGTVWRAHLSPDKPGTWTYTLSFTKGKHAALDGGGTPLAPYHGKTGSFEIAPSDKTGRDFRAKGRLQYVGKHHLQFAGSGEFFLKAGPDAPETLLAYTDFDGTTTYKPDKGPLKTWEPHLGDWKPGDPTWKDGKGKGLIGALNYLAGKGVNAFSFLTYNAAGDGDNVWPFIQRNAKLHYDCSKLDQWGIVFDHATAHGLYLHFKLQENESDDERLGMERRPGKLPEALDGGKLGPERKLYCREIIARFGHALALNWNIGEENTQSTEEVRDMVKYLHDTDPYKHHIVLHTFPPEQELVYRPLIGDQSLLTGVSLQNSWKAAHQRTLQWIRESAEAGRPWVVAHDEQNPAGLGVPPDPGYKGHDGIAVETNPKGPKGEGFTASKPYTMHDVRKLCLWGHLMAGGAGVEYYFGYKLPENDLNCEDWRSRDKSWDYCRIALDFFRDEKIPFAEMQSANALIGNPKDTNDKFCFAKPGELYLVYLPEGGGTDLEAEGSFTLTWFNPRDGQFKPAGDFTGKLNAPDANDWLAVIRRR